MNSHIEVFWKEVVTDFSTAAGAWQLVIIMAAIAVAWLINDALRAYVLQRVKAHHAIEDVKLAIGGFNRVLFPLSSLLLVSIGKLVLSHWQHVSMLSLAERLLIAMAVIRLLVYALRYIIAPGGWLKTLEKFIAWLIWTILALHLTGYLSKTLQFLAATEFSMGKVKLSLLELGQALITVLVTLLIALWLSKFLEKKIMLANHVSVNMRVVMIKLIRIILIIIAVLIALSVAGIDITLLSVFGGALGVGLGFGLQKIASNYVSGFIILLDKSLQIGDVISTQGQDGTVIDLRSRYLVLRKDDGTEVVMPNETFITNAVINRSFTDKKTQVKLFIKIGYESDLELALKFMLDACQAHQRILADPAANVQISNFSENGIDLCLNFWIKNPDDGADELKTKLYLSIWNAFKEHKITIACSVHEVKIIGNEVLDPAAK